LCPSQVRVGQRRMIQLLSYSKSMEPWMASQIDRRLSGQEASSNTSLLIVTFAEGIAATLVASGLQVGKHHALLVAASIMLGLGFIAILRVLWLEPEGWR
jgi:hypothetical protein